jgi:hypothetical protein
VVWPVLRFCHAVTERVLFERFDVNKSRACVDASKSRQSSGLYTGFALSFGPTKAVQHCSCKVLAKQKKIPAIGETLF